MEIVTGVGSALDYAHQQGITRIEMSPANILRDGSRGGASSGRHWRISGLPASFEDSDGLTSTNLTVGTVAYAAPEQLMGSPIDGRADQYALAATAFHLLTGSPPFQSTNPVAVISQHLSLAPPKLSDYRAELAPLDEVFAKALAKDPEDRFTTCTEFADAFVGTANTYIDKDVIGSGANIIPAAPSAPTLPAVPVVQNGPSAERVSPQGKKTRRKWLVAGSVRCRGGGRRRWCGRSPRCSQSNSSRRKSPPQPSPLRPSFRPLTGRDLSNRLRARDDGQRSKAAQSDPGDVVGLPHGLPSRGVCGDGDETR